MGLKSAIKRIAPPIVLDLYRRFRYPPTWKGVYPHIGAVPATERGRRSEGWRRSAVDPAAYDTLPAEVRQGHDFLAFIAAVVCRENGGRLRVIDFGGGLGISYVHLLHSLRACQDLEYHVVDLEWACREGSRLFATDPRIRFHRSLPDRWPDVDVVYATVSIEYVEDYAGLLRTLCGYRARYVLLVDLHAGDFPTYATAQLNVPGTVFPQWFLNRNDIIEIVNAGGYDLIMKGAMPGRIDQRNFPAELRLPDDRPCVLLFARSGNQ